jgi:hypothetical protein
MNSFKVWLLNNDIVEKIIIFNGDNVEDFGIFSDEELDLVDSDNTIVSRSMIHADDSICEVKHKIMKEIECQYGDIYLFCYKKRKINLNQLMASFTTRESLEQFMKNIDLDGININETFSLGDNEERTLSLKTSLGMHTDDLLFSPNPFHAATKDVETTSMTVNDSLLLGDKIECNNIYMCLAKDVIGGETAKSVYFPHLGSAMPHKDTDTIDEMYRVYYNRPRDIVSNNGIKSFTMEIETHHPRSLNIVFRNLHCDAEFPFIQYNRGFHTDNIYRLYGVSITKNGKRIPLLNKEKIEELSNTTSAGQIAIYNNVYNLVIIIDTEGKVTVRGEFKELKAVSEIETMLKTVLNPLFAKYCNYQFNSFDGHKIHANYQYLTVQPKPVILNNKYVEAVFGKDYRYNRVNNFAQMSKFKTFLYDIYVKHGMRELVVTHNFNMEDAEQLTREFATKNAGAKTTIMNIGNNFMVRVYDLDNVDYIRHLNIYLDSLVLGQGDKNAVKMRYIETTETDDYDIDRADECVGFSDDDETEDQNTEVRNVWLENNFFTLYRSIVHALLESIENQERVVKANDLAKVIKEIVDPVAVFSKISKSVLDSLSDDHVNALALVQNERQMLFPKRNLLTHEDNCDVYAERMAEEISKMKKKVETKELVVKDNEFIVLESLLKSPDYFIDMVPSENNECLRIVPHSTNVWRFFANTNRLEFNATPECSFGPIVYMLHQVKNQLYRLSTIKNMLWKAYCLYFGINKAKMVSMMKLKNANLDIEELMKSEAYYMTPLDMWVFAETYKLPVIMFSSVDRSWSVFGGKASDQFFFYESIPGFQGWPNNVLINRTFGLSEMNAEFANDFGDKSVSLMELVR